MKKRPQGQSIFLSSLFNYFLGGFTLLEFLVVIFIIVLVTSTITPAYIARRQEFKIQQSANLIAYFLRKALEMAMSADEYEGIIPSGGYGVYFQIVPNSEIFLFADCNNDHKYTQGNNICGPNLAERIEGETLSLERKVELQGLTPASPLNITFQPPDPVIFIDGSETIYDKAEILIEFGSKQKKVIVNRAGLITIENLP